MDITERIRSETEYMTRSERHVASFVLEHKNDIAFFTLDELAKQTDRSSTSVLRFCRRLGFDGFKQFQQTVRAELKYSPDLMDKFRRATDEPAEDTLLAQLVQQGISCIRQTFWEMPAERLQNAVERIAKARRIYIFGMRESQALAAYTYSRLLTVRGDVFLYQEGYAGNVEALLSVTEEDVFLVYLFHRYTRQTMQLLEILRQRNIPIILITSPPTEPVARFTELILPCEVDVKGIKNSSLAPVCLSDYLCNAVAMAHAEDTMQRMRESEELFRRCDMFDE